MIKLPSPRGPEETEEISRRARERWGGWEGRRVGAVESGLSPLEEHRHPRNQARIVRSSLEGQNSGERRPSGNRLEAPLPPLPQPSRRSTTDMAGRSPPVTSSSSRLGGLLSKTHPAGSSSTMSPATSVAGPSSSVSRIRDLGRSLGSTLTFGRSSNPAPSHPLPRGSTSASSSSLHSGSSSSLVDRTEPVTPPRGHGVPCSSCHSIIHNGPRFECVNCPTSPGGGFNLVRIRLRVPMERILAYPLLPF